MNKSVTTAANNTTKVVYDLTVEEWEALSGSAKADIFVEVISVERAKKVLKELVGKGIVKIADPKMFARWTNKRVVVKGIDLTGVSGYKIPSETLTIEEFNELTPDQMVELAQKYISNDRAKVAFKILVGKELPMTIEQAMLWSNGRLQFEGVEKPKGNTSGGRGTRKVINDDELAAGIILNGNSKEVEAEAIPDETFAAEIPTEEEEVIDIAA